jgi:hypothetical protein
VELIVRSGGSVACIYDEAIDLAALGSLSIRRASYVEPCSSGLWFADLSPVGGPRLGPSGHRSDALAAELAWLKANWLQSDS